MRLKLDICIADHGLIAKGNTAIVWLLAKPAQVQGKTNIWHKLLADCTILEG